MKRKIGIFVCACFLALSAAVVCACAPEKETPPQPEPEKFELVSTLEFYNWNDPKDLVLAYKGAAADSVSIDGTALGANGFNASEGKLVVSKAALDALSAGKYTLKAASGAKSDTLTLFVGEQIRDGSRYTRRQAARGENVVFFFDAEGSDIAVKCGETALAASDYAYDADSYALTVKAAWLDNCKAGALGFTAEAGGICENFVVVPYGGAGAAASAVFGGNFAALTEDRVSPALDLFAQKDTQFTLAEGGLCLTGRPQALLCGVPLESAVYCLDMKVKTEASYLAVLNGAKSVATLTESGLISAADSRSFAEKQGDWWNVRVYFAAEGNTVSLKKGSADERPIVLQSILLQKTNMPVSEEDIDLGAATYYVGGVTDVTAELPFDSALIHAVRFADVEIPAEYLEISGARLSVSHLFFESAQVAVGSSDNLVIEYDNVTDAEGTIAQQRIVAVLTVRGRDVLPIAGQTLAAWNAGENLRVLADLGGGTVKEVKLGGKIVEAALYRAENGCIEIDKSCFEGQKGLVRLEISNGKGVLTVFAHQGERIVSLDAESGAFDEKYKFYNDSVESGGIVSGEEALSGKYSYKRNGSDTWNNIFETISGNTAFVPDDYYLISLKVKADRSRDPSDPNYNEIRTLFDAGASLSEITYTGGVKLDTYAKENGKASVFKHTDGSMDLFVTLPAVTGKLQIAMCFEGSIVYDDICVWHLV